MADGAQVDADLVGAAGGNGHADERDAVERLGCHHPRYRFTRPARTHRDTLPVDLVPADRQVDAAPLLYQPPDESDIFLFHLPVRELPCELDVCPVVLGNHHHPGRAAVETVNDAGSQLAADAAQILNMMQERVDEGTVRVAGGGMHDHAGRLVDHDEIRVVVKDIQGQRFRAWRRRGGRRDVDSHDVAGADGEAGARGGPVEPDPALPDQPLDLRSGSAAETSRQKLVETAAGVIDRHVEIHVLGRWRLAAVAGGHVGSPWRRRLPLRRRRAPAASAVSSRPRGRAG